MKVTLLQNIKVYRVQDDDYDEDMIIVLEDGEIYFYTMLVEKYSDFEKALAAEKLMKK